MRWYCILSFLYFMGNFALLPSAYGVHIMYDHFTQINGTDLADARSLRIRKINRTTTAMNGTVILKENVDNSYLISLSVFHSVLGNNQFYKHPMKIPSIGACDFMRTIYTQYYPYLKEGVDYEPTTKCPLPPTVVQVRDYVASNNLVPPFARPGLYRVRLSLVKDGNVVLATDTMSKVYSDFEW